MSRAGQGARALLQELVASPTQVLVEQALPSGDDDREVVRIGDDGQVEGLGRGCECARRQIDLSGDVGIFNGSAPGATIRDFAAPGSQPVHVEPVSGLMRVAGRFAAWADGGDVVVYDRGAGTEIYRLQGVWPGFQPAQDLDLQADGKVAFYFEERAGGRSRSRIAWASPGEPFVHRLPVGDATSYSVKMDGDRIVFVRDVLRRLKAERARVTRFGELGVIGLTDRRDRILVKPVESSTFSAYFDFDGTRVAWLDRTCRAAKLRSATLSGLMAAPRLRSKRHGRPCRLGLVRPARRHSRDKDFLRFPVDCAGFEERCATLATVLRTLRAYRIGGRRIRKGTRVNVRRSDTGEGNNIELELTRIGKGLVRRPGPIRLTAQTIIGDSLVAERRRGRLLVR